MKSEKYISNLMGAFATSVSTAIEDRVAMLGGRSFSHDTALVAIDNHPNETIDILSKVLGLTHSGAVRLINTLEQEGLVYKYRSIQDARAAVLSTTQVGKERVKKILSTREEVIATVFQHFDSEQKQSLVGLLEVAMGNLAYTEVEARRICRLCDEGVCRDLGCPVEAAVTS